MKYKARFLKYQDSTVVHKSTQYAKWTIPALMADLTTGTNGRVTLERDFQEIGPLLVNNLASKLAGLLFPSTRPFYKLSPSEKIKKNAAKKGVKEADLQAGLARMEMDSCKQLFMNASYNQLVIALKHLIVTGNVLMHRDSKRKKSTAYGLQSFACKRDGSGNLVDCIVREFTDFDSLPLDIQFLLRSAGKQRYDSRDEIKVELYTRIKREVRLNDQVVYVVSQEADGQPVGEPGTYPEHLCPWHVVTWSLIAGEHYGRGLVEDYAGGFAKLSDVSHAGTLYTIASTKVVNLVSPGMGADIDELQDAETGEYVQGSKESVNVFEAGDAKKLEQVRMELDGIFTRLGRAFMYKASTRNAERVTAYELKQDAMEAETTLGGVYSSLAESWQIPLAHLLLTEVNPGMLEGIVTKTIKLDMLAGIPAMGRQSDVQNLLSASQDAAAIIPTLQQLSKRIDPQKVFDLIMAGQSVDTTLIYKDEETEQAEAEAAALEAQGQQQMAAATSMADQAAQLQQLTGTV